MHKLLLAVVLSGCGVLSSVFGVSDKERLAAEDAIEKVHSVLVDLDVEVSVRFEEEANYQADFAPSLEEFDAALQPYFQATLNISTAADLLGRANKLLSEKEYGASLEHSKEAATIGLEVTAFVARFGECQKCTHYKTTLEEVLQ